MAALTHTELLELTDLMDHSDFRRLGLNLGFTEAALQRNEHDRRDAREATYIMLADWLKNIPSDESRGALVKACRHCRLTRLAENVETGNLINKRI